MVGNMIVAMSGVETFTRVNEAECAQFWFSATVGRSFAVKHTHKRNFLFFHFANMQWGGLTYNRVD